MRLQLTDSQAFGLLYAICSIVLQAGAQLQNPMISSLHEVFRSYQFGSRATRARSLGAMAAGAAALAAAPQAEAQIVSITSFSGRSQGGANIGPAYISIFTGAGSFSSASGKNFEVGGHFGSLPPDNVVSYARGIGDSLQIAVTGAGNDVVKLSASDPIGPGASQSFATTGYFNELAGPAVSGWSNATGYIGISFNPGDGVHYGWVKVQTDGGGSDITVLSLAYNTVAGQGIDAGQTVATAVPEPAAVAALLAAGALGVAAYRRRKNIQRAAVVATTVTA